MKEKENYCRIQFKCSCWPQHECRFYTPRQRVDSSTRCQDDFMDYCLNNEAQKEALAGGEK